MIINKCKQTETLTRELVMSDKIEGVMTKDEFIEMGKAVQSHLSKYEWFRVESIFSRMWTSHENLRAEAVRLKDKLRKVHCYDYEEHRVRQGIYESAGEIE